MFQLWGEERKADEILGYITLTRVFYLKVYLTLLAGRFSTRLQELLSLSLIEYNMNYHQRGVPNA